MNCSPALGLDEDTDKQVKMPMMSDLLDVVNVESAERAERASKEEERSRERSLPGYCRPLETQRHYHEQHRQGSTAPNTLTKCGKMPTSPGIGHGGGVALSKGAGGTRGGGDTRGREARVGGFSVVGGGEEERSRSGGRVTTGRQASQGSFNVVKTAEIDRVETTGMGCNGFELIFPFGAESKKRAGELSEHARAGSARKDKVS